LVGFSPKPPPHLSGVKAATDSQICRLKNAVTSRLNDVLPLIALAWFSAGMLLHAQPAAGVDPVKAAVILRFPEFVQWPAAVWDSRESVELCVAGAPAVAEALKELVAGETVHGRSLEAREFVRSVPASCHVVFIGDAVGSATREEMLRSLGTRPVLSMSDHPTFLDAGGMVQLRIVNDRLRFEINLGPAQRNGLRVSSRLLQLATRVIGGPS
jgi:hypothetical protein